MVLGVYPPVMVNPTTTMRLRVAPRDRLRRLFRRRGVTTAAIVEEPPAAPASRPVASAPATPYSARIPADVADAWRMRVADAGVNQTDAVTAAFRAFMTMDAGDLAAAVLADKRQRRDRG
jgi:hypothetical protein